MSRAELLLRAKGESQRPSMVSGLTLRPSTSLTKPRFPHTDTGDNYLSQNTKSFQRIKRKDREAGAASADLRTGWHAVSPHPSLSLPALGCETLRFAGLLLPKRPAKGQDSGRQKQLTFEAAVNQISGPPYNTWENYIKCSHPPRRTRENRGFLVHQNLSSDSGRPEARLSQF